MKEKFILIDVGNTALKWATLEDPDNPHTIVHSGEGHFKKELYELWESLNPSYVLGCTVAAPEIAFSLTKFFNDHHIKWEWVRSALHFRTQNFTIQNAYHKFKQLGSDRWYAAIGAIANLREGSLLVVHMGTATTADSIRKISDDQYVFQGGRIAPGPSLMHSSLLSTVPTLSKTLGPKTQFPDSTETAIATGIIDAQVGLVLRAMDAMKKEERKAPRVILAGGAAQFIAPHLQQEVPNLIVRHNLVLNGLAIRARQILGESNG